MENYKELEKKLSHSFKNAWEELKEGEMEEVFVYGELYKKFLDTGKTERECVDDIILRAEKKGFVNINELLNGNKKIKTGMKIYANNKGKSIILFVIGKESIDKGMNIVGGHIDSPRIDLKPFPLYEDSEMTFLKTHYYGGIKKYQWVSMPLSMHGVLINKNGEKINISIGEDINDPVFFITDLLPHLAKDQNQKKLNEGITGEGLNILFGNIPFGDKDIKEKVKLNTLKLLNEKYGIVEEDFTTAEIEIVPAEKARDVGIDRSMISAYGHDDRVCSFAGSKAILEIETPTKTAVGMFMDKEEVGSMGNTGSESKYFENIVAELIALQDSNYSDLLVRRSFMNTKVLSADVCAGFDPNFPEAYDKRNSGMISHGVQLVKYTGSRGKGGCNDANAEYASEVRNIFTKNGVVWQTGELGKVDQGGGGTIAYILANAGAEVIDCGVPMLSMHAPYELVSKVDAYMTYKAYKAFINR
ncbi:aminopeptidase [Helicovermis profundi]|uniref:M18 family aminopeptidase n=1 Tax=Helicovermis profundi TaxID=3065157 RepID=A0AAU9E8D3_9FIRM|nr:aminopeptidase [Clostridia bacterium S502]